MGDMLDNRDFSGGDSAEAEVSTESQSEDVTSEENTEAQSSESPEVTQESEVQETNNTENDSESEVKDHVEETTEKTEEESQPEVQAPTRAQKRIQKILGEKKALEAQLAQNQRQVNPYDKFQTDANGEIEMTPTQLNEMVASQVQTTLHAEREQRLIAERADAWDDDIGELMESNPELNPKSKVFNKKLSDALVDLIRVVNTDDGGNLTVKKLPSEVFSTINGSLSAARTSGQEEASLGLNKQAQNTAVQSSVADQKTTAKYSDTELANMQITDPRKYAGLIEDNLI